MAVILTYFLMKKYILISVYLFILITVKGGGGEGIGGENVFCVLWKYHFSPFNPFLQNFFVVKLRANQSWWGLPNI